jgi:hypothetical protein
MDHNPPVINLLLSVGSQTQDTMPSFSHLRLGLKKYLPGMALKGDPPDLGLPSS